MKKRNGLARKVIAMAVMVMMVFQVGLGYGTAFAADNATYNMDGAITKVSIKAMVNGSWYEIPQSYDPNMPEIEKNAGGVSLLCSHRDDS